MRDFTNNQGRAAVAVVLAFSALLVVFSLEEVLAPQQRRDRLYLGCADCGGCGLLALWTGALHRCDTRTWTTGEAVSVT